MRMRSDSDLRMRRQGMDHRTGMGMGRRRGTMGRRRGTMGRRPGIMDRRRGIGGHRLQTATMDHRLAASTVPLLGIGVPPRVAVAGRWSADGTMVAIEVTRIIAHESLGNRGDTSFRSHDARAQGPRLGPKAQGESVGRRRAVARHARARSTLGNLTLVPPSFVLR
jgi:hypothetical protein